MIYITPIMNYYPRNVKRSPSMYLRVVFDNHDDSTRLKLYHPKQYQYLQHPVLWVVLNISTTALKRRLKRLQLQHPMKEVGLMIYSKTSMVRKSDNLIYHKIKKTLQWKSDSEIHRFASGSDVHWKLINLHCLSPI